jgi:hypothetical protein
VKDLDLTAWDGVFTRFLAFTRYQHHKLQISITVISFYPGKVQGNLMPSPSCRRRDPLVPERTGKFFQNGTRKRENLTGPGIPGIPTQISPLTGK